MPYITDLARQTLESDLGCLFEAIHHAINLKDNPERTIPGVLTYIMTRLLIEYYHTSDFHDHVLADGILGATAKEFYRKSTACLEDKKSEENGDVFKAPN